MYVTNNLFDNSVSVINTTTNTLIDTDPTTPLTIDPIPVGFSPWGIAYDTVHQYMYVVNQGDGTVSVIDTNTNTVIDTDPTTPLIIDPITVGDNPAFLAYDPINQDIYVVNQQFALPNGTVSVIDTNTNTVIGSPITVGNQPIDIAYDPINHRMYVTNQGEDTVSVINLC